MKQHFVSTLILCLLGFALVGCSSNSMVEGTRKNREIACQKLPDPDYQKCMDDVSATYETYKQERAEIKKGN